LVGEATLGGAGGGATGAPTVVATGAAVWLCPATFGGGEQAVSRERTRETSRARKSLRYRARPALSRVLIFDVEVLGEAWLTVTGDRVTADQHEADAM
jgi:hypothetical protein